MDCFIIRVYRHITQDNGQAAEIAGLVERVGRHDNGRPFSSYKSLVSALREEFHNDADAQKVDADAQKVDKDRLKLVRMTKHR